MSTTRSRSKRNHGGAVTRAAAKKQKLNRQEEEEEDCETEEEQVVIAPPPPPPPPAPVVVSPASNAPNNGAKMTSCQMAVLGALRSIQEMPDKIQVVENGIAFINSLVAGACQDDENVMKYATRVMANGVVSLIISAMTRHANAENLQTQGRTLLGLICDESVQDGVGDENGIKAILQIMELDDVVLQTKCCDALWPAAAKNTEYRNLIGDSGAISTIAAALEKHPRSEPLFCSALGLLADLTYRHEANKTRLADAGVIDMVLDFMTDNKTSTPQCRKNGMAVLRNLACQAKERSQAMMEQGAHLVVEANMKQYGKDELVQGDGCHILANLAPFIETTEENDGVANIRDGVVAAGVIPIIVKAMEQHPKSVDVQMGASLALKALYKASGENHTDIVNAIVAAKGLVSLSEAIRIHRAGQGGDDDDDEMVVSCASEVLGLVTAAYCG